MCTFCGKKRRQVGYALRSGDVKGAVKHAAEGAAHMVKQYLPVGTKAKKKEGGT